LHKLYDKAAEMKDNHLCKFLEDEFIVEQYQALKDLCDLFTQVKRCGDNLGLQILDTTILNKFSDPKFSAHSGK
jgi:ferritin